MTDACSGRGPWRDRIIVVTGSTSGIGRQFAIHFAAEGGKVIACGRNDRALRKLQTEHPTIEAVQCDITVRPNVLALVETIRDRYGMLDVLVNNAGIMERVDLLEESVSDERIAHEIAVNLTGPVLLTRRLLPLLRPGRNPMIVMVTSGYALLPATRAPTYSATNAGLHSFTLALRRQLCRVGIRVVEVLPPLVDTPATRTVSKAKMSPAALVDRVMHDISHGKDEIMPGKVRLLPMLMRLAPSLTAPGCRIMRQIGPQYSINGSWRILAACRPPHLRQVSALLRRSRWRRTGMGGHYLPFGCLPRDREAVTRVGIGNGVARNLLGQSKLPSTALGTSAPGTAGRTSRLSLPSTEHDHG